MAEVIINDTTIKASDLIILIRDQCAQLIYLCKPVKGIKSLGVLNAIKAACERIHETILFHINAVNVSIERSKDYDFSVLTTLTNIINDNINIEELKINPKTNILRRQSIRNFINGLHADKQSLIDNCPSAITTELIFTMHKVNALYEGIRSLWCDLMTIIQQLENAEY
jgi:hypothetical protein